VGNSNRQKSRLLRQVCGILNNIGKGTLRLERDPMGRLYEVSRFTMNAIAVPRHLTTIRSQAITRLKGEGWVEVESGLTGQSIALERQGFEVVLGEIERRHRERPEQQFDVRVY